MLVVEGAVFAGEAAAGGVPGAGVAGAAALVAESEDDSVLAVGGVAVAPVDALDDEPRLSFL